MGLKQIATESFYRVTALEAALVAKGIIREGEVTELRNEAMRHESEVRQELRQKFWDKLKEGIEVELYTWNGKPKHGTLIAKSVCPFTAVCIYDKKGKVACFSNLDDNDIAIKTPDVWECISSARRS